MQILLEDPMLDTIQGDPAGALPGVARRLDAGDFGGIDRHYHGRGLRGQPGRLSGPHRRRPWAWTPSGRREHRAGRSGRVGGEQ